MKKLKMDEQAKKAARSAFENRLRKKIRWIAKECWPNKIGQHLAEINAILDAANTLGVSDAEVFDDEELRLMENTLRPFRTLEMDKESFNILVSCLGNHGIKPEMFIENDIVKEEK